MEGLDDGDPFELAAALLAAEGGDDEHPEEQPRHQPPEQPQELVGAEGGGFELAAAMLMEPERAGRRRPLGMPRQSAATAAYARKCREAGLAKTRAQDLEARIADLNERPLLPTIYIQ